MQPQQPTGEGQDSQMPNSQNSTDHSNSPGGAQLFTSNAHVPMSTTPIASPYVPATSKHSSSLVVPILLGIGLLVSIVFGVWAFMSRMDYKDNSDQKVASAVEVAKEEQKKTLDAEFAEKLKLPYDVYTGPIASGSLTFQYPRTWSAYVNESTGSGGALEGYAHPGFVPSVVNGSPLAYALRFEVVNQQYSEVMQIFNPLVKSGDLTAQAYSAPKVPSVVGLRLSGKISQIQPSFVGTMIVLPIRDKTLKIWTESNSAFLGDFETTILPSLVFAP